MGNVRLLPLLAIAALCLFVLKAAGLLTNGGYMLSGSLPAGAQPADAGGETGQAPQQQGENPGGRDAAARDDARNTAASGDKPREPEERAAGAPGESGETGENAVLTSLAERRKMLDKRERKLEHRENLLKAAEKRVEERIERLKKINKDIEAKLEKQEKEREEKYAKLASLYANMKSKEAARIFNRLEIEVLTELMKRMKARTLSPILADMDPTVVERVTMEITSDSEGGGRSGKRSLPKIASERPDE